MTRKNFLLREISFGCDKGLFEIYKLFLFIVVAVGFLADFVFLKLLAVLLRWFYDFGDCSACNIEKVDI